MLGFKAPALCHPSAPHRFLLPSYFPLVLRAVSSLEGVALSVDKNFKLISAGKGADGQPNVLISDPAAAGPFL